MLSKSDSSDNFCLELLALQHFQGLLDLCRFVYKFVEKSGMQNCVQVCGEIGYADLCTSLWRNWIYREICVKFVETLNNLSSSFSWRLPVVALDMASFCFEVGNSYGAADDLNDALSCVSQQRFLNWISSTILTSKLECNLKIWAD
jgi:hypothetical protein